MRGYGNRTGRSLWCLSVKLLPQAMYNILYVELHSGKLMKAREAPKDLMRQGIAQ